MWCCLVSLLLRHPCLPFFVIRQVIAHVVSAVHLIFAWLMPALAPVLCLPLQVAATDEVSLSRTVSASFLQLLCEICFFPLAA